MGFKFLCEHPPRLGASTWFVTYGAVCCSVLQSVAVLCSAVHCSQYVAVCCSVLMCLGVACDVRLYGVAAISTLFNLQGLIGTKLVLYWPTGLIAHMQSYDAYSSTKLYQASTHRDTLQHTATHCNTLNRFYKDGAINKPQPKPTSLFVREDRKTDRRISWKQLFMRHKVFLNELLLTATHCNTLQHTATHNGLHSNTVIYTVVSEILWWPTHCHVTNTAVT